MGLPQPSYQEPQVEMSPHYDKLFDADLNAIKQNSFRRQMTVGDCEHLLHQGLIGKE